MFIIYVGRHSRTHTQVQRPLTQKLRATKVLPVVGPDMHTNWRSFRFLGDPYQLRVNLIVAGVRVSLPAKQPDILRLPSQCKAK